MMRALAAALLCAVSATASAQEPSFKPPPAAVAPAPEPAPSPEPTRPQQQEQEQEYYIVPAYAIERVNQVMEAQRREIERLRAAIEKGKCI